MRLRDLDSSHERRVRARARGAAQALTQQRDKALESKAAAEAKLRAARETLALAADDEARAAASSSLSSCAASVAAADEAVGAAEAAIELAQQNVKLSGLAALWHACAVDVETLVHKVVHKVVHDKSVSLAQRFERARAIGVLGMIFAQTGASEPWYEVRVRASAESFTLQCELRSGAAVVSGVSGEADVRVGDKLVEVEDEHVVGYNHVLSSFPALAAACAASQEAQALAAQANVSNGGRAAMDGQTVRLTLLRKKPEEASSRSMRDEIAKQLGIDGQEARQLGLRTDDGQISSESHRSWAELAGRHGGDNYHFGDVTRATVKLLGSWGRRAPVETAEAADKSGWLGKRSDNVGQWRRRWFTLRGQTLSWARGEEVTPHGAIVLHGAEIHVDDFEAGQAFSLIVTKEKQTLVLAASSLRDRNDWREAIRLAAQCHDTGDALEKEGDEPGQD